MERAEVRKERGRRLQGKGGGGYRGKGEGNRRERVRILEGKGEEI